MREADTRRNAGMKKTEGPLSKRPFLVNYDIDEASGESAKVFSFWALEG